MGRIATGPRAIATPARSEPIKDYDVKHLQTEMRLSFILCVFTSLLLSVSGAVSLRTSTPSVGNGATRRILEYFDLDSGGWDELQLEQFTDYGNDITESLGNEMWAEEEFIISEGRNETADDPDSEKTDPVSALRLLLDDALQGFFEHTDHRTDATVLGLVSALSQVHQQLFEVCGSLRDDTHNPEGWYIALDGLKDSIEQYTRDYDTLMKPSR